MSKWLRIVFTFRSNPISISPMTNGRSSMLVSASSLDSVMFRCSWPVHFSLLARMSIENPLDWIIIYAFVNHESSTGFAISNRCFSIFVCRPWQTTRQSRLVWSRFIRVNVFRTPLARWSNKRNQSNWSTRSMTNVWRSTFEERTVSCSYSSRQNCEHLPKESITSGPTKVISVRQRSNLPWIIRLTEVKRVWK